MTKRVLALLVGLLWIGCSTTPIGPRVVVLPGDGAAIDQFRGDDARCRGWAGDQIALAPTGSGEWSRQQQYDVAYMQCMYSAGHQVPVGGSINRARHRSDPRIPPPPPGRPPPPPPGS